MSVFIANFGQGNAMWPEARDKAVITIFNDEGADPFWRSDDREGYIRYSLENTQTLRNVPPTRPLASRWFNLPTIVTRSNGDIWIHRERDELWWTISTDENATSELRDPPAGVRKVERIMLYSKPVVGWAARDKRGRHLRWAELHPKARTFLFTEGTLQQLSDDNAAYARALVGGDDLSFWHSRADWRAFEGRAGRGAVTTADARQRAILTMVLSAEKTARYANGQIVQRTTKNKGFLFQNRQAAENYVSELMRAGDDLCALTGIPLQYHADAPADFRPSLDRIDSSGHYEPGNLQVVCWFANRWKNNSDDEEFRILIGAVQSVGVLGAT